MGDCKYCKHFIRHYTITESGRLIKTEMGHCGKKYRMQMIHLHVPLKTDCALWEKLSDTVDKKKQCISEQLCRVCERLNEIFILLDSGEIK